MTLHYDGSRLTRYAAGGVDRSVSEHVAGCAPCAAEVSRLRAAMDLLRVSWSAESAMTTCLAEEEVAAFVAGTAGEAERARCIEHAAGCAGCASAVASIARAMAADGVTAELRAVEEREPRPWQRILLPLAGAAMVVLLLTSLPTPAPPPHRSTPVTAFPAPTLVSPVGMVVDLPPLSWRAVPMADRYRVTLFGADGHVVYEGIVTDTVMLIPDSVSLGAGQSYFWTVAAQTGWERWVKSEMAEFSLRIRAR